MDSNLLPLLCLCSAELARAEAVNTFVLSLESARIILHTHGNQLRRRRKYRFHNNFSQWNCALNQTSKYWVSSVTEQQRFDVLRGGLWFGDTKQLFIPGPGLVSMTEDDAMRSDRGEKGTVIPLLRKPLCRRIYCMPPGAKATDETWLSKAKPRCFKS